MPRLKLSDELKAAVKALPEKEKDKLVLRLLPKNPALVDRLVFTLLEDEATQLERREDLRDTIIQELDQISQSYFTPGLLLKLMRKMSAAITRHVKMTRDPYGEIALNFLMLNRAFDLFGGRILTYSPRRSRTLNNYVVRRAKKLLTLLSKLHEDYRLDFQDEMRELGRHIFAQPLMLITADVLGLDLQALLKGDIPDA